ncbi:dynamin family protein [Paenibacillus sp. TAB 01]|uniref:dynamin family protein n=1 Tax=Paenibacillus sp. TAB 01 TaxID=3368988 RepID=UPI003750B83E
MFINTITAIGQEVQRLLAKQQSLLSELLQTEHVLKNDQDGVERSLDRNLATLWHQTLTDEVSKVEGLEMTLAVVGTMKAGKSTTINAIIGREVLPNRNRPMTTLPTVIRHKRSQETPQLRFPKPGPFNKAILAIKNALLAMSNEERMALPISASEDGQQLIEGILSGKISELNENYSGNEGIFNFLKSLNDISRMCELKNLNLPSPLIEYSSMNEFPVIEVEFYHLKGKEQQIKGSLALIDTPEPNEAGQAHLRGILEEQLQKASAVLAVLDYTQLNSEADAEVRASIEQVSRHSGDRLFVLVNKFDQKDRNSMGEADVRRFVSKELFENDLPQERVFPVSSQYGYLANYALNELAIHGTLPSADEAEWVEDFGQRALGLDWEEELGDAARVKQSAERLWKKSMFIEPLDQVIGKAYSEAALIALKSAVEKMNYYDLQIVQYLKMRTGSVHIDINELKQFIKDLEENIISIEQAQQSTNKISENALKKLSAETNDIFLQGNKALKQLIENLFIHGKRLEAQQAKKEEERKRSMTKWITSILNPNYKTYTYIEIDQSGKNKFSNKSDAHAFLEKIHAAVQSDTGRISEEIQALANKSVQEMESQLQQRIHQEVSPVLEHAAQALNNAFDLKISFQQHAIKEIKVNFDHITRDSIEETSVEKTKTRYERRWYTLWLKEHAVQYTVHEDEYHVDTKRIGKEVVADLEKAQQKLQKDLEQYISKELAVNLALYFNELKQYLDKYRGNLLDGLKDKQENEETLGKLLSAMEWLLSIAELHQQDLVPLLDEVRSGAVLKKEEVSLT